MSSRARHPGGFGGLGRSLLVLAAVAWTQATSGNLSNGGFAAVSSTSSTWTAGMDSTGRWYGSGYDTTGSVADLTASAVGGVDCRALVQAVPMPEAATYTVSLRARFSSPNQTLYWHVLGVTSGTTLTLTNGGIPQVITQTGVKSLLKVSPASGNGTGNWVSYSNSFTVSAQDAAAYQYLVVALVASRTTGWVAQFDDVYTTVPAETTDSAAGLTAEWFDTPNPVHALSEITWSSPIRTTKEEQINWLNTSTAPFVTGVPMDRFAVRLTGRLSIPTAGDWTLFLGADDGTLLTVDGTTLLAADTEHSFTTRQATATLSAGTHAIEVRFFENGGSQGLVMSWLGPGMTAAEVVPGSAFRSPLRVVRWRPVSADE